MGRGINRGRGAHHGNRPMPQQTNYMQNYRAVAPPSQSQGLQDIDMELELLKRKREIIEKQQQMLSSNIRQINSFEEPSYYDNSYDSYGGGGGSNSRKRPIPVWEHESNSPPKRFSGPPGRGARKSFESRAGPPPHNPRSDFQPARSQRRPNPPPPRRDFKPTKVTKPYAPAPPPLMNFSNYEAAQRKKLVQKAAPLVSAKKPKAPPATSDDWVLRSDKEPNRKMIGRLELALGSILKAMKADHPEYEDLFASPGATRAMKQILRDRIRLAMIGKSAYDVEFVKSVYFETYPPNEENDVLMTGLEHLKAGERFVPIKSDDAKTYFKKNMARLMRLKLEQMLNKMEAVMKVKGHQYGRPTPKKPKANKAVRMNYRASLAEQSEVKSENVEKDSEKTGESADKIEGNQEKDDDVQIIESKELTIDVDKHDTSTEGKTGDKEPTVYEEDIFSTAEYVAYDNFMNIKMIQLLKKYIPRISSLVDWDPAFNKIEASVRNETRVKLGGEPTAPERRPYAPFPYNVKLMGKPSLPKRKVMQKFLEPFQPINIKRHKAVHNLLFLAFDSKESYDKILQANGTIIGRSTLDIMAYENKFLKNQAPKTAPNTAAKDDSEQIITPDIDEQITNLLHTIRESQAADTSTDNNDTQENVAEGTEDNDTVEINDGAEQSADNDVTEINDDDTEVQDLTEDAGEDANDVEGDVTEIAEGNDAEITEENGAEITEENGAEEITEENGTEVTEDNGTEVTEDNNTEVVEENTEITDNTAEANDQTNVVQETIEPETVQDTQTTVTPTGVNKPAAVDAKTAVGALKEKPEVKMTPTRASARLANPSNIKTRRTSTMQ